MLCCENLGEILCHKVLRKMKDMVTVRRRENALYFLVIIYK